MILYDFDYERAASFEDASSRLRGLGARARVAAGGTDLLPNMRTEIARPETLISLAGLSPEPPSLLPDGSIRIDALTRLAALENFALVRTALPMLAKAAGSVAGNQIRQMGTLGGNLCQETRCLYLNQKHDYQFKAPCYKRGGDVCYPFPTNAKGTCWSVHMSDTAPALIALDAQVEVCGEAGMRRMNAESLYTGNGMSPIQLAHDELLTAIIVPRASAHSGWGYCKSARRGGLEFGIAVIAVTLVLDESSGVCRSARIVIGAVRERPVRLAGAEEAISGRVPDEATLAEVAAAAAKELNPLPHHGFTKSYIRDDLRIKLRRTLESAVHKARGH